MAFLPNMRGATITLAGEDSLHHKVRYRRRKCRSHGEEHDPSSAPRGVESRELHEDIRHVYGAVRNVGEDGENEGAKQGIERELRS